MIFSKERATTRIQEKIFSLQDAEYQKFQAKLNPTMDAGKIIGVRVPKLRALAKELRAGLEKNEIDGFLDTLPHDYFEENLLHSFLIEQTKDFDECMERFEKFLPFIDNWAVCDTCHPKVFRKNAHKVLEKAKVWIRSSETYTVRYGIDVFMTYFLDELFDETHLETVAEVRSGEYYVNMMQAWYYATALAKQWDSAVKILESRRLQPWVHNKTIQKARESFRVTEEHKEILLGLKMKVQDK